MTGPFWTSAMERDSVLFPPHDSSGNDDPQNDSQATKSDDDWATEQHDGQAKEQEDSPVNYRVNYGLLPMEQPRPLSPDNTYTHPSGLPIIGPHPLPNRNQRLYILSDTIVQHPPVMDPTATGLNQAQPQLTPAQVPNIQLPIVQVPNTQVPVVHIPVAHIPVAQVPNPQVPNPQAPNATAGGVRRSGRHAAAPHQVAPTQTAPGSRRPNRRRPFHPSVIVPYGPMLTATVNGTAMQWQSDTASGYYYHGILVPVDQGEIAELRCPICHCNGQGPVGPRFKWTKGVIGLQEHIRKKHGVPTFGGIFNPQSFTAARLAAARAAGLVPPRQQGPAQRQLPAIVPAPPIAPASTLAGPPAISQPAQPPLAPAPLPASTAAGPAAGTLVTAGPSMAQAANGPYGRLLTHGGPATSG
ncbi:hypothetical protein BT63DRAFT_466467 [Microthyrium microscopicum]|uniref:Uncharacterized protein n=1 Tax=Microthyrium microscopicum TaxID=703497 RepID=A0A6A6UNE3_9PEZI|nr:hypothetical protein BT63DRAFT_466467 [Microthyrium microscopicum]